MPQVPCQKGTSFLPVVEALKQRADCRELVPRALWKYFDKHMLISGWYPEGDYWVLVGALVNVLEKEGADDVWRGFAKFSALRDIGGKGTSGNNSTPTGVYKTFAKGDAGDPESFFRRAVKLWSQYHDSGTMKLLGGRTSANSVVLRLVGFNIPLDGFVRLQGYYLEEYARLVGIALECAVLRNTARGDPFCEWECRLGRTEETEAYVASLPQLAKSAT